MEVNQWFCLPETSGIAGFAAAQVQLYRHNPALQDYFLPLQLNFRGRAGVSQPRARSVSRLWNACFVSGYEWSRSFARRKHKVDVLFCPMPNFQRRTENQMLMSIFAGLAQTGATMLCLLPDGAPCRAEMESWLKAHGRGGQAAFLDPFASIHPLAAKLLSRAARLRGAAAFEETFEVLRPSGLAPGLDAKPGFDHAAAFVEAWHCLEPGIEFDAVVTRCHWQTLCSPVCRSAHERGKPVITFQQGVIAHTLDVPVSASKYIAFGDSSATFLADMNRAFFQAVNRAEPDVEFIPGGSLFDRIPCLPDQFSKRTLLIMDEPVGADDFYGIASQREAIFNLAYALLASPAPPRIIIRPHPFWNSLGLDAWKDLIQKFPGHCELSHAAWTLEEDLGRSSVVLGIFSGALTVAAASGLPTFFMTADTGFATEDLACFRLGQTCSPAEALPAICRVLSDERAFGSARAQALKNARQYYSNGANLELNAAFFERLLSQKTSGGQAANN